MGFLGARWGAGGNTFCNKCWKLLSAHYFDIVCTLLYYWFTRKHTHSISKKSHESSVFMRQQSHCHLYHLCLFHFMLYSKSHKLMI